MVTRRFEHEGKKKQRGNSYWHLCFLENKFAIGSSDKNVAICYYEKEQRFWAAEMMKKKPKSTITCIAWHPNNQLLAVGSCDYRCRLIEEMADFDCDELFFVLKFRIYSAFIKAVDGQPRSSNWGRFTGTGELLHEFQSGLNFLRGEFRINSKEFS